MGGSSSSLTSWIIVVGCCGVGCHSEFDSDSDPEPEADFDGLRLVLRSLSVASDESSSSTLLAALSLDR